METIKTESIGTHTRQLAIIFAFSVLAFSGFFLINRLQAVSPIPIAHAASSDYLMTLDGVSGEIHIESFSWGVSNTREAGSGQATGRRQYQPLIIRKRIDKASPLLFRMAADGKSVKTVTLTVVNSDGTQSKVNFQDLSIMSFQQKGDMGSPPEDSVSFTYHKVTFQ